jgi:hypothetical protein
VKKPRSKPRKPKQRRQPAAASLVSCSPRQNKQPFDRHASSKATPVITPRQNVATTRAGGIFSGLANLREGIFGTPPPRYAPAAAMRTRSIAIGAGGGQQTQDQQTQDQQSLALLTLPVLAMIIAYGTAQMMTPGRRLPDPSLAPIAMAPSRTPDPAVSHQRPAPQPFEFAPASTPPAALSPAASAAIITSQAALAPVVLTPVRTPDAAVITAVAAPPLSVAENRSVALLAELAPPDDTAVTGTPPPLETGLSQAVAAALHAPHPASAKAAGLPRLALATPEPRTALAPAALDIGALAALAPDSTSLASLQPADADIARDPATPRAGRRTPEQPGICEPPPGLLLASNRLTAPTAAPQTIPPKAEFGAALAAAAVEQIDDLVIYDDRYRRIAYPMGDVSPLYGVCTDVVIRAYRALGIDLQQLVQQSGLGSGDTSIDHRRTETLRRFFARHGENIPVSSVAENYRPGDVVTYHRPQNTHSRSHIAVVSNVLALSGRYMIVHNRGWGPQLEDGLFVDEITGHYRYAGAGHRTPLPGGLPLPAISTVAASAPRTACLTATGQRSRAACAAGRTANPAVRLDGKPVGGLGR